MRIVAGDFKGRALKTPRGGSIRPTSGRVKEALFSIIDNCIGGAEGAIVVDLFAGAGGLGLEAISRGAKFCYFGGNSAESINLIKTNIAVCGASGKSAVIAGDFEKALSKIPEKADIIFLDPPYGEGLIYKCFEKISSLKLLNDGGIIAAEHGAKEDLPDDFFGFGKIKEKKYGSVRLSLYS